MSAGEKREALDAVIREQLSEAWQRGMDTAPYGPNAQADQGGPAAFGAISRAVDDYAAAIASARRGQS